jgi:hypothetical protein
MNTPTPQSPTGYAETLLQYPPELFRDQREDDVNVAALVTAEFQAAGHSVPDAWLSKDVDESSYASQLRTAPPVAQRDLINRIFRLLLSRYPAETMEARYCLTNSGDLQDWLAGIRGVVIPDLMRLRLV